MTLIGKLLYGLKNAVSPNLCPVCGKHLVEGEEALCIGCEAELPRILLNGASCPDIEDLFVGSKIVDKAVSMFAYSRTSVYSALLKDIKYHNRASLAQFLGQQFARELKALGYFEKAAAKVDNMFAAGYLLKAGLVAEKLGDDAKALSFYKTIKDKYPQSMEGYDIDKYIGRIENK